MSDEKVGCGISRLWLLPTNHVFIKDCALHDRDYDLRRAGKLDEKTSYAADQRFLKRMLSHADTLKLRLLARFMYRLARTWGIFRWPTPDPNFKLDDEEGTE